MSAMLGSAGFGPLVASSLVAGLPPARGFATPLDFAEFAETLEECLSQGSSADLTRWEDGAKTVPYGVRPFLWLVVATTLSATARHNLRRHPGGANIYANARRSCRTRPPGKTVCFGSKKQEFDSYAAVFRRFGTEEARRDLDLGQVVLLALRNESSTLAHHGKGSYDDRLVVMRRLGDTPQLMAFPICTEPGAQYSVRAGAGSHHDARYNGVTFSKAEGNDMNADGIRDAGRLSAGTYHYFEKSGGHLGARAFQVKITQVAQRDTNGDGRFTSSDATRIDRKGAGTSMYIHRGGADNVNEPNTWSAGCQTIPKNKYEMFLHSIPIPTSFYYVLVNAAD